MIKSNLNDLVVLQPAPYHAISLQELDFEGKTFLSIAVLDGGGDKSYTSHPQAIVDFLRNALAAAESYVTNTI